MVAHQSPSQALHHPYACILRSLVHGLVLGAPGSAALVLTALQRPCHSLHRLNAPSGPGQTAKAPARHSLDRVLHPSPGLLPATPFPVRRGEKPRRPQRRGMGGEQGEGNKGIIGERREEGEQEREGKTRPKNVENNNLLTGHGKAKGRGPEASTWEEGAEAAAPGCTGAGAGGFSTKGTLEGAQWLAKEDETAAFTWPRRCRRAEEILRFAILSHLVGLLWKSS